RDLAGEPFGNEDARTLAGAAEFHDVQAVIIGLDEARQRAALAERRYIAGGADGSHRDRLSDRRGRLGLRHRPANSVASIASAAFAMPLRSLIPAPILPIRPRRSPS